MFDNTPHPLDTSDIILLESLTPLIEALAENVHDTWAKDWMMVGHTVPSAARP